MTTRQPSPQTLLAVYLCVGMALLCAVSTILAALKGSFAAAAVLLAVTLALAGGGVLVHKKHGTQYGFSSEGISLHKSESGPFCQWGAVQSARFVVRVDDGRIQAFSGLVLHTEHTKHTTIGIDQGRHKNLFECAGAIIPELEKHQIPCTLAVVKTFNVEERSVTTEDGMVQQLKQLVHS